MTDYFNNISLKNVILNSKLQPSFLTSAVSKTTTLFSDAKMQREYEFKEMLLRCEQGREVNIQINESRRLLQLIQQNSLPMLIVPFLMHNTRLESMVFLNLLIMLRQVQHITKPVQEED